MPHDLRASELIEHALEVACESGDAGPAQTQPGRSGAEADAVLNAALLILVGGIAECSKGAPL